MREWTALWAAIALNVSQVFLLDGSDGLRQPALLPIAAAGFLAELWLFARAMRCLTPVVAYAAYGATPAVVTLVSVAAFGEALTVPKLAGVAVVTIGIVLLATAAREDDHGSFTSGSQRRSYGRSPCGGPGADGPD
jgi:multidrug transporter EmrE-like cation transporter